MRSMVLGLAALLTAGIVGLMTADAQTGRNSLPVQDMRRLAAFEQEMMGGIDRLMEMARKRTDGKAEVKVIFEERAVKSVVERRAIVFAKPTMTLDEVKQIKSKLNARINGIKKTGRMTEMDRRILRETTLNGMQRQLGR